MDIRYKNKAIKDILDTHILPLVSKPGRYVGNELNLIFKREKPDCLRFAIAFPELYEIAMSSQAVHLLYHLLNRLPFVWAERVFAPWDDMEAQLRLHQLPLYTLESFTPLNELDVVGFSLQYELTYSNVLNMLDLAHIPLTSRDRGDVHPLIIAGGPCTSNPEPLSTFIDAFYVGDAEAGLDDLCTLIYTAKQEKITRKQLLLQLARLPGIYVPVFYHISYNNSGYINKISATHADLPNRITTRVTSVLCKENYSQKPMIPLIEVTHDRLAVEVMRGCTAGCRFCNAGMIYRPVRERNIVDVMDYTEQALAASGFDEISFLSLSISDYALLPGLLRLTKRLLAEKCINVSFPSMRIDSFSEEIAQFASDVRKSGFTFAPEAGSERLRTVINKNISDKDLLRSVDIALRNGWKVLKFYFMIGLPTETKEDIEAIGDVIERIVRHSRQYGWITFTISISPFVPKPHTPFQWEAQVSKEELQKKIDLLRKRLGKIKRIKLSWRDPAVTELECILGRGDRSINQVIYHAWQKGARFDGWSDHFRPDIWESAFTEAGLTTTQFTDEMVTDHRLPWYHIDKGVTASFLQKEREKAYQVVATENCQDGLCTNCGMQRLYDCYPPKRHRVTVTAPDRIEKKSSRINHAFCTYRLRFQKTGYARFISHLDIIRLFDRACRRAKAPIVYSKGFNPRPKMSFAPPLALGYTSDAEYVDLVFHHEIIGDIKQLLNPYLPDGMRIVETKMVDSGSPSLCAGITAAEFIVDLRQTVISQNQIRTLLAQRELKVERQAKGACRHINVRPFIASIKKRNQRLVIRTKSINGRTCRIREILSLLTSADNGQIKSLPVHRTEQFIDNHTPIEQGLR